MHEPSPANQWKKEQRHDQGGKNKTQPSLASAQPGLWQHFIGKGQTFTSSTKAEVLYSMVEYVLFIMLEALVSSPVLPPPQSLPQSRTELQYLKLSHWDSIKGTQKPSHRHPPSWNPLEKVPVIFSFASRTGLEGCLMMLPPIGTHVREGSSPNPCPLWEATQNSKLIKASTLRRRECSIW